MSKQLRNVLIVGSGGREHALAWKLSQSPLLEKYYVAPGNGGTEGHNVDISPNDIQGLTKFAKEHSCLTIVGPETPLALGIVDHFLFEGVPIVGPTREQAKLEWSKSYAKQFMSVNNIPTAEFRLFSDAEKAIDYVHNQEGDVVVKADGLAAGKGVVVCSNVMEAERAVRSIMIEKVFGDAGSEVIIEEKLEGREISLMAVSDGTTAIPFGTATDHKRALDGDKGPNTGGMGAYSPTLNFGDEDVENVMRRIVRPSIRKSGYHGFLYAGLMLTSKGPVVIEFNSRLGDPETQVILPRLDSDLFETLSNISNPDWPGFADMKLQWANDWYCTVVMCSKDYPSKPKVGDEINGIQNAEKMDQTVIFHSGTIRSQGKLLTNGGRVLCVTAGGRTLKESSTRAYSTVEMISWNGEHHRHDIGCPLIPKRV